MRTLLLIIALFCLARSGKSQSLVLTGAEQTSAYFKLLRHKRLALVVNQGSRIENTSLVDSLLNAGLKVSKILAPEHGFRGAADAGEAVENALDKTTGLPVISLYGKHFKPSAEDLSNIDFVVFDLQDVGARFYTYLSTLHYVMQSCAAQHIPLLVLDRPNPTGFCIDGPVLDTVNCRSFIGLDPVPIVYGMSIGEYARMLNGEGWLGAGLTCDLTVQELKNYTHQSAWHLPLPPSPNLPVDISVQLYPSLCLFEGTVISVGRGTDFPFQVFGNPQLPAGGFSFTPVSMPGKSKHPPFENQLCQGTDLRAYNTQLFRQTGELNLSWLISAYQAYPEKAKFFIPYFEKLAGNLTLRKQIEAGLTEKQIRESWKPGLDHFREIRKKYILYTD